MDKMYSMIDRGEVRDVLGEGLLWAPHQNALYWTDILTPALNRLSLADGAIERWAMPEPLGWVIERRDKPGFIAGFQSGIAELQLDPLRIVSLVDPEPHLPDNRLNDAKADSEGRIWAGSMPFTADRPTGSLYRLDHDLSVEAVDSGYHVTNGPAFSPDGRWFYHTETIQGLIYRFPLLGDGMLGAREVFIRFEDEWGRPDGMTVDREGGLWVAHWGGGRISRFTPDGRHDRSIALPASQITNIAFAGPQLDRMFVTSAAEGRPDEAAAGALFEVQSGARGFAPHKFAG